MYGQIKNPKTNRYIYIGGETYKKLLKEYDESFLLSDTIVTKKTPKSPSVLKYNLFSKYNINPIAVNMGKEACIYKATKDNVDYAIRITNVADILLDNEGFIKMIHHYKLPHLPLVFEPCKNIKSGTVYIYIMPWLEHLEDALPTMSDQDKYNFLYDLLLSLKQAKALGIEHNDIYYDNILIKDNKPIFIDPKPTFNNVNDKLQNKDFVSFYNLLNYMALPQKAIYSLQTSKSKKKGIAFDILLDKLEQF